MARLASGSVCGWLVSLWLIACGSGSTTFNVGASGSGSGSGGATAGAGGNGSSTGATMASGTTATGMNGCVKDVDCGPGKVCSKGMCIPECPDCKSNCCSGECVDVTVSLNHCGKCDNACPQPANVQVSCKAGVCSVGDCLAGFFECDGDAATGCESSTPCVCKPGEVQACYPGPPGSEGKGPCKAGTRKCNKGGTAYSLCADFIVPTTEICNNGVDEDCNGKVDDAVDADGDGWSVCDGDCCETTADCAEPKKVNPGAFEFVGNMVDDDCDPATSDSTPPPACSANAVFAGVTAKQMAEAMELCQFTTEKPPMAQKKWGVVKAEFRRPNAADPVAAAQAKAMADQQTAILINYGTGGIKPQKGATMAGMSSGKMRDQDDPGYVNPNGGTGVGYSGQPPAAYLAANGNKLPSSAGCSGTCPSGNGANDGVNLWLQIRVPTNALSFSYQFRFFSAEYWTWSCTAYNDFYLALLTSLALNLPKDKNISFDSKKNPVSVNNGFFELCAKKGCYTCPSGTGPLAGTGMQLSNTGGGTEWLKTTAPIVPGETITLELMVFDVSDGILDSLALLDAFEWSISASAVGTGPPG